MARTGRTASREERVDAGGAPDWGTFELQLRRLGRRPGGKGGNGGVGGKGGSGGACGNITVVAEMKANPVSMSRWRPACPVSTAVTVKLGWPGDPGLAGGGYKGYYDPGYDAFLRQPDRAGRARQQRARMTWRFT